MKEERRDRGSEGTEEYQAGDGHCQNISTNKDEGTAASGLDWFDAYLS